MKGYSYQKIWDPVTRLWHWVFAFSVIANWSMGEFMSFDTVEWHFIMGYFILGLIVLRIVWGIIGPSPIRITTLVASSFGVKAYLKRMMSRQPSGTRGHNPLGSLSIIAMLLVFGAQGMTGLCIETEDFFEEGPLYEYVSEETAEELSRWHHRLSKVGLALVLLHILAVLFYLLWKRENLIKPMFTGWKWVKQIDKE